VENLPPLLYKFCICKYILGGTIPWLVVHGLYTGNENRVVPLTNGNKTWTPRGYGLGSMPPGKVPLLLDLIFDVIGV